MSIDFIQYHLNAAFLSYFIENSVYSFNISKVLSRFYDGKEDILKDIVSRLKKKNLEIETLSRYLEKIVSVIKSDSINENDRIVLQRCISTLLYVSFRLFESRAGTGQRERMKLLKELYSDRLDNIHIYRDFYTLDFSSVTIRNSTFTNYTNLFKSTRDDKTLFIDSKVDVAHLFANLNINSWNNANFDSSCILGSDLKIMLKTSKTTKSSDIYAVKKDIVTLLGRFQKSGRFITKTETHLEFPTNSKMTFQQLIHEMLFYKMITNKAAKEPYNWAVTDSHKDSVNQLLQNNHVDSNFEKIIFSIYSKFYN